MSTSRPSEAETLYETDFYAWTQEQAILLGSRRFEHADLANLIEEIQSLGRAQIHALRSHYRQLCTHLLKFAKQPEKATRSWTVTVTRQRIEIALLLKESPSLKSKKAALFKQGYEDARKLAAAQTGLPKATFPSEAPFTVNDAESEDWLPQGQTSPTR